LPEVKPDRLALEVTDLSVSFGRRTILRDLSFSIPAGSALAVIGPNGAGKTVLFKALIGAIPHTGTVRWAPGTRFGYVPQKLDIERHIPITGFDFLEAVATARRVPREAISPAIAGLGLDEVTASRLIGALSGGQFQRLLLASALLVGPNALLLDEATSGIDEHGRERTEEVLDHFVSAEHGTLLLISHELSVVYRRASHVLCLAHERAWFGRPREILTPELLNELYGSKAHHVHDAAQG
jgi:zinc transport system ATP-binding protein